MASCSGKSADTRDGGSTLQEPNPPVLRKYTYEELSKATHYFSNSNRLGSGGFGDVFKGSLDGKVVAIKKLKYKKDGEPQHKLDEIEYLKRVSHRNLVKLIGYCDEGADKLLVLEFVPNKTLRHHLDGKENVLEWSMRMKIAIKSAYGLQYLHENCKIIHQDIKADNILLDNKFEPKVTDFSLAKFLPNIGNVSHITSLFKGANVYADPEYGIQKVSEKSDIYSYGIVLLELITGKKALSKSDNIANWAKSRIEEALNNKKYMDFVDFKLHGAYDERQMQRMISCAAACVYEPSNSRPDMKQIIEILEGTIPMEGTISLHGAALIDLQSALGIESLQISSPVIFTYQELAKATNHFSNNNLLGEGGFGMVYKGSLGNNGIVAIKKLKYLGEELRTSEFEEEIKTISRIYYRHLVKLIGYCNEGINRLLVYELAPNKSLRFHLQRNIRKTMNWSTRVRIAMGVAKGLAYLHEWCQPKIIHGNIKVDNILLTNSFEPKISDYGFAKENEELSNSYIPIIYNSKGSLGYLAPEYINSRKLTDKCDVFSFGIILLELITGKRAIKNEGIFHNRLSILRLRLWMAIWLRELIS
ncbi:probable LRR receptor-like serine/threonine-protein kinase At1g06840 isoform X3 [Hevea brasiliensis]|uniref:probable LRR receptor-like serine/threonine-protein kinase At1g06840 isoform X3 n=1 Tax=Hevea brasiliensis TaxID=3981 RepID=UPI0025E2A7A7|nr:probable LRR receptor-like serine/threonine-protein kinase At1g06840 isoform X3 [Hevea brasiliensis]